MKSKTNNNEPFSGKLIKMQLRSTCMGYGPRPEPDEEVEQLLIIDAKGRTIHFEHLNYGDGNFVCVREETNHGSGSQIKDAFTVLEEVFKNYREQEQYTDITDWKLTLTNEDGERYKYNCSFGCDFLYNGQSVSKVLRDILNEPDLWIFTTDGVDTIESICVHYTHTIKLDPPPGLECELECVTWKTSEQLIIDRDSETITLIRQVADGVKITSKYEIQDGVCDFLDGFDEDELFAHTEGNPPNVIMDDRDTSEYQITVTYQNKEPLELQGTFDKMGLPDDWDEFAEDLFNFLSFYGFADILDSKFYGHRMRCEDDVIHLKVRFDSSKQLYSYRTDNDRLDVGDEVVVPVGKDNEPKIATVVEKLYYKKDEEPTFGGKIKTAMGLSVSAKLDTPEMPS